MGTKRTAGATNERVEKMKLLPEIQELESSVNPFSLVMDSALIFFYNLWNRVKIWLVKDIMPFTDPILDWR